MTEASRRGDLGEGFFEALCLKAGLTPTVPIPDRFGKDFNLEWPLPNTPTIAAPVLDRLPVHRSCIVQVKTTTPGTGSVRLSLPAALRLVHSTLPSFVAAIELDTSDDAVGLTLFEIRAIWIGKILTAVRKAQAAGVPLSKRNISFNLRKGQPVDLEPATLRRQLETAIGNDLETYGAQKKLERLSLGIDPDDQLSLDMTLQAQSADALIDAFMGDGEIECVSLQPFEKRFGIKLPGMPDLTKLSSTGKASVRISPIPSGDWTFTVLGEDDVVLAQLPGKAASPGLPGLEADQFRILFESPFLSVMLKPQSFRATYAFTKLTGGPVDVAEAALGLETYAAILKGKSVRLETPTVEGAINLSIANTNKPTDPTSIDHSLRVVKAVQRLQELALDTGSALTLGDIADYQTLFEVVDVMDGKVGNDGLRLTLDTTGHAGDASTVSDFDQLLTTGVVIVGEAFYAYAVRYQIDVCVDGAKATIRSTAYTPLETCRLPDDDPAAAFDEFNSRLRRLTGLSLHLTIGLISQEDEAQLANSTKPDAADASAS